MNKAQCSTFAAASATGLTSLRNCLHLPDFNHAGKAFLERSRCASTVPPLTQGLPILESAQKVSAGRDSTHCGCAQTCELLPCQGDLSFTPMTVTLVDTKLHVAFTPLVTVLAPWKGLTVLRVLTEACRTLCYEGGCTLIPEIAHLPSCHNPRDAAVIHFNSAPSNIYRVPDGLCDGTPMLLATGNTQKSTLTAPDFCGADTNTWAPSPRVRAAADSGNAKHG